jgi:hypothetical protein
MHRLLVALVGPSRTWLASAQLPRNGWHFLLDQKVPKKSSQKIGFFAAQAFALQGR